MHLTQVAFLAVLLAALTAALSCGGKPERLGAAFLFAAAVLSPLVQHQRFAELEIGIAAIDAALLLALLALAIVSERKWPIYAAAFQAVAVLTHAARIITGPIDGNVYGDLLVLWSYPVALALLRGSLVEGPRGLRRTAPEMPPTSRSPDGSADITASSDHRFSDDLALLTRLLKLHSIGPESAEVAAQLLARSGTFGSAVSTPSSKLRSWGYNEEIIEAISFARRTTRTSLRRKLETRRSLAKPEEAIDYLFNELAHLPTEQFRVLYLNARFRLILDHVHSAGSVTEAPIFPREVVKQALESGAVHLILAHNHPSGDPTPSRDDILATRAVREAARAIGVSVVDHIVVSASGHVSMRATGMM